MMKMESSSNRVHPIGRRNIASIFLLGTAGQIAWAVENSWFNTFVYDRITTDPAPIAWMVAVSAIMATITSLLMGTLSDRTAGRWGQRKPYIVGGYIFWGILTAIYPMIEWIQTVGVAIVMVIVVDAVMTFFGSTANDAAFNAWLTDIGHSSNRNRIDTLNKITVFLAQIIALGAAGIIIDQYGYFIFFYLLGGLVTLTGMISAILLESQPISREEIRTTKSLWKEFTELFDPKILKDNRILFLLFLNMALGGIASQIYMPYLFIFSENYLGFTKTQLSLYLGSFMLVTIGMMAIIGAVSHKYNRKSLIIIGSLIGSIFMVIMSLIARRLVSGSPAMIIVFILFFIGYIAILAAQIAHGGWLLDRYPEGNVGKYQGVRMIFMVLLPMVIGPPIGAAIIRQFGIPTGDGFIPTPEIFLFGGLVSLLAIIPILLIPKAEGIVKLE
jgi:Na+/melibiose symporter-like transporter